MLHRLVKKFALFTMKILYQNQQHGKQFARFRAENFDVKDEPRSGRSITEKSDEIMEKVERDKHVEIARELASTIKQYFSIDYSRHKIKSFTQSWIQKEARCLGSSRVEC